MSKSERLMGLVVALLDSGRPLSFQQIRDRTGFYGQDDFESARRMFERDKDDLRRLGIPLDTRQSPMLDSEYGYVIERRDYELPDVALDRDEVAALAMALEHTDVTTARLGLTKLAARAPDPVVGEEPETLRARIRLATDPIGDVAEPLLHRRPVAFRYRTAAGDVSSRTVDPYAVVARRGSWYLVGRDHDRDAVRAFRFDRLRSQIGSAGDTDAFEVPDDLDVEAAVSGPASEGVTARVAVAARLRWEAERRGGRPLGESHRGWEIYEFEGVAAWRLRSWLLTAAGDAEILEPVELRSQVIGHLRSMLETGREAGAGAGP